MIRLAVLVAALQLAAGAAHAQSAEETARWTSINGAFPPPAAAEATAAIEASTEAGDCPAAGMTLGVISPATAWRRIDDAIRNGQLVNGWSVTVKRADCPEDQAFARYVLLRDSAGGLTAQQMHIGRSHLDLDSLVDTALPKALRTAANTAGRDVPGCSSEWVSRSAGLLRTEVVEEAQLAPDSFGIRRAGAWRELWSFGVCGRVLTVFLDFEGTPDGTKTTVSSWASLRR